MLVVKKRGPRKNFVQDLIAQQSPFMDKQKIAEATKKQKLKLERFQILGIVTLFNVIVSHLFAKHVFSTVIQSCPERKIVFSLMFFAVAIRGPHHNLVSVLVSSAKDFPQTVMALNSSEISSRVLPLVSGKRKKV